MFLVGIKRIIVPSKKYLEKRENIKQRLMTKKIKDARNIPKNSINVWHIHTCIRLATAQAPFSDTEQCVSAR